MRRLLSYGLALIIVIVIGVWLASGTLVIPGNGPGKGEIAVLDAIEGKSAGATTAGLEDAGVIKAEAATHEGEVDPSLSIAERQALTTGAEAPARSVRIATYTMRAMPIEVPLRGRTKAKSLVTAVPETSGVVDKVHVEKGATVAAGDLLCTLDPGTRAAAVAQAKAALDQAKTAFDTNSELRAKGLASINSAGPIESAYRGAQAAFDNATAELARTEVRAKIGGVVQAPIATAGAMLGAGAPCATIVELDPMLFVGSVPEVRIGYAKEGLPAKIVTITGATLEGKVSYVSSTADPATRTFAVEIEMPNPNGQVRDGITAEATVDVGSAPAHLIPQSVLTLDDSGVIGVRSVENDKVAFYPVTILRDTREGVWVTGLPPKIDIITVGQEFVQPGQVVKAGLGPKDATETPAADSEALS